MFIIGQYVLMNTSHKVKYCTVWMGLNFLPGGKVQGKERTNILIATHIAE